MNKKIMEIEEKIWHFIEKHKLIIFFIIITMLSLFARANLLDFKSGDYNKYLGPWFDELKENGGLKALSRDIGNYNAPYMTIMALLTYLPIDSLMSIKLVSMIFDYVCAFAVMKIAYIILKENKNKHFFALILYGITLFLPTVILNSACWGQADSIYTAFILISIVYLLQEKYAKSFIFLGISFAFKLQFIFILPLYVLIYISKRKFPVYYFLILPLMNAIMCLPAIICGKSVMSCVKVYLEQSTQYGKYLSMNFPNVYNLIFKLSSRSSLAATPDMEKVGIAVTLFIFVIIAFVVLYKKVKFDKQKIIEFGLWSVMIATFFLPHMHDRYLFVGDILSILYFIYNRDKIYLPVGITLVSLYGYASYLFGQKQIQIQDISFLYLILLVLVTRDIYNKYFKTKKQTQQIS